MSMPKPTIKDLLANAINGLTLAMKEIEAQYPEPGGLAHAIIKGAKPAEKPAPPPPDFDALTDVEVVAWAMGFRPSDYKDYTWWIEPHRGWYVSQVGLPPATRFDDCLTALDAVFGKGGWNLFSMHDGYVIDADDSDTYFDENTYPTPTAAAVAAIRAAIKEREHA